MKKNKVWLAAAGVCLIMIIAAACGFMICRGKAEGIEDMGIFTGVKNDSLIYDSDNDRLYIGTHDNLLVALDEKQEMWRAEANGAFSELFLDAADDRLYAANEDNHVYIYRASDGTLLSSINVQRKVVGLDVNKDRTKIAVITRTGGSKSNLIFYSAEGEELSNSQYTIPLKGVKYCKDGETLLLATKRGDIRHITEKEEVLDSYETNYEIAQLIRSGDTCWVVNKKGYYYELNDELECLRKGQINNTVNAIISSIGVSKNGEYVLVGSEEGWLFVMNDRDSQIYTVDLKVGLSDFAAVEKQVYIVGFGDFVKAVHVDNLANQGMYQTLMKILRWMMAGLLILFVISVIQSIPGVKRGAMRLLKQIWLHKIAYIMILPTFLLIFGYNYRSIFIALTRAFTNWSRVNDTVAKMNFVGFDNFKSMLTEGYFLIGMKNLILLLVTGVVKTLTVPLAVAWLVYSIRGDKRKYLHRFLFVLPMVVPGVISAMTWQRIYDPSSGLINNLLKRVGLESFQRVWLGDSGTAIWAIIFMGFPFLGALAFLVYYGGLISIDNSIIESAGIDGASRFDIFWRVQLPMIRPQLSILVTLQIIGTMQDFNSIFILTGGGPGTSTYVPALELYLNAAQFGRYGYASAMGIVLLIFTLAVTLVGNRLTREKE